ncbi:MAG: N-acetyltransferase [Sphingobacteriales bacterium]|nr:MAG: N-acetyltransferase [Sphingobacteriales bacterium]
MIEVKHSQDAKGGSFYYERQGHRLAEMVYVMAGNEKMIIEHTDVDDSLRGQGVGKQLQEALVEYVRANNIKVLPLCPFAKATFAKTKEWQDVLVENAVL